MIGYTLKPDPEGMKLPLSPLLALVCFSLHAEQTKPLDFQEVYSVIKTNLTDITDEELSRDAALGLIKQLGTKVQLVTSNASAPAEILEPIGRRALYNENFGYIQIRKVDPQLPPAFHKWLAQVDGTNAIKGLILDLRYAKGQDYESAAKIADPFTRGGEVLLSLGDRQVRAAEKQAVLKYPLAILINGETSGAAEAIAAMLKENGAGLVIGGTTAGEARLFETFTLSTGQKLRIGKIPVKVANRKVIPAKGVAPDIAVSVKAADEKILYQDPHRILASSSGGTVRTNEVAAASTNRVRRFNEAELVRRHREGTDGNLSELPEDFTSGPPEHPVITDPALARALDFLKGIAVLQEHRAL
jgi:hypothetical protein